MDRSEIKHGDKLFLYGQFLVYVPYFDEYDYNTVTGYMTQGGYVVHPVSTPDKNICIAGFVTEMGSTPSLAPAAPFAYDELIDVTHLLSKSQPLTTGTKVWMPTSYP